MADEKKPAGDKKPKASTGGSGWELEAFILVLFLLFGFSQFFSRGGFSLDALSTFSFVENSYVARFILVLKFLSAGISIISWVGIMYIVVENSRLQPTMSTRLTLPEIETKVEPLSYEGLFAAEWNALRSRLEIASDQDAALLVIEADAIFDKALKYLRIPGETMGERLTYISGPDFQASGDVWDAHKMRNQIAHEGRKGILYVDAVYAVEKFEKGLKELEVI